MREQQFQLPASEPPSGGIDPLGIR